MSENKRITFTLYIRLYKRLYDRLYNRLQSVNGLQSYCLLSRCRCLEAVTYCYNLSWTFLVLALVSCFTIYSHFGTRQPQPPTLMASRGPSASACAHGACMETARCLAAIRHSVRRAVVVQKPFHDTQLSQRNMANLAQIRQKLCPYHGICVHIGDREIDTRTDIRSYHRINNDL